MRRNRLGQERRLASLEKYRKEKEDRSKAIQNGLSGSTESCGNHVVFQDDSDEEIDLKQTSYKKTSGKVTGKAADDWLGLDGSDDESEIVLKQKPHLESKGGEKLMALQRRIGRDERFELTEAFADSDEDEENESDEDLNESESHDFEKEKEKSLMILQSVLGNKIVMKRNQDADLGVKMKRYDPNDSRGEELVIGTPAKSAKKTKKREKVVEPEADEPQVSKEKFYSVSNDLKLSASSSSKPFSFADMFNEELSKEDVEQSNDVSKAQSIVKSRLCPSPVDSSDEDIEDNAIDSSNDVPPPPPPAPSEGFFFLINDPHKLTGRLAEGVQQFVRTKTLEEIESEWCETRAALTQDYKKKRKDAMRRRAKSNPIHSNRDRGRKII
ncbi:nucleolar protein 8-like [Oscarella lobularis]|uniref:nucleolar protein 8-like n=1 Tax=Oscarella lobularis TaxID=121494 RepID=UPI00331375EE